MTDKQLEEKKREFLEYEIQIYREMKEDARVTGVHDLDELDRKKWQWIKKLVEEVEKEQRKLIEQFFDDEKRKNMPDVPIELLVDAERTDTYDMAWDKGYDEGAFVYSMYGRYTGRIKRN